MADPARNVRIPDDLWSAAQALAASRGETVSDVIRSALLGYVTIFSSTTDRAHTSHRSQPVPELVIADGSDS